MLFEKSKYILFQVWMNIYGVILQYLQIYSYLFTLFAFVNEGNSYKQIFPN